MVQSLVTGAAGFIGSHLVDALLARGDRIVATDRTPLSEARLLAAAHAHPNFRYVEADLADPDRLPSAFGECGPTATVWHLAANSDIASGASEPALDFRDTFQTTRSALAIAAAIGATRFVLASTSAVYGETDAILREDSGPLLPISNYGAMKLASEAAVSAAVGSAIDAAYILRFPNVVGPRATHGVVHDFCAKLARDGSILHVLGDGTQQKPYVHVSELVEAMLFAVDHADGEGRHVFNIGPEDEGVRVSDIAHAVVRAAGGHARIAYAGGSRGWHGDVPRFRYSTARLAALGWNPAMSSAGAIERAVAEIAHEWGLA